MSRIVERIWTTSGGLRGIVVGTDLGHRCGYVELPWWHPWHGLGLHDEVTAYDPPWRELEVEEAMNVHGVLPVFIAAFSGEERASEEFRTLAFAVRCHGGLTWAGTLSERVGEDLPPTWLIGFDCGHAGDRPDPELVGEGREYMLELCFDDDAIWTHAMVVAEVEALAAQVPPVGRRPLFTRHSLGTREAERDRRAYA